MTSKTAIPVNHCSDRNRLLAAWRARTNRIPIERRAEAAVIAWLRHQTTAYDSMKVQRVKKKRREVRRMLAEQSRLSVPGWTRH